MICFGCTGSCFIIQVFAENYCRVIQQKMNLYRLLPTAGIPITGQPQSIANGIGLAPGIGSGCQESIFLIDLNDLRTAANIVPVVPQVNFMPP